MDTSSDKLLDEMLDNELDNLGIFATSNIEGMSKIDKDKYIESLLSEIHDLKTQLHSKTVDIDDTGLEELANIDVADLNETITLKPIDDDDDDDDGDGENNGDSFNPNDILNMLGSFMNNDMLCGSASDIDQVRGNPIDSPMFKVLSKMMEGMNENVQVTDEEEMDSDGGAPSHEKVE